MPQQTSFRQGYTLTHQTSCLFYFLNWSDKYLLGDLNIFMHWNPASSYVNPSSRQHNLFSGLIDLLDYTPWKKKKKKKSLVELMELVMKCLSFSQSLWLRKDSQLRLTVNPIVTHLTYQTSNLMSFIHSKAQIHLKLPLFYFLFLTQKHLSLCTVTISSFKLTTT